MGGVGVDRAGTVRHDAQTADCGGWVAGSGFRVQGLTELARRTVSHIAQTVILGGWGAGYRVRGIGFRDENKPSWLERSGFRVQDSGFRVQGPGCRVQGSGFRVWGLTELARRTVGHRAQQVDRRRTPPPVAARSYRKRV